MISFHPEQLHSVCASKWKQHFDMWCLEPRHTFDWDVSNVRVCFITGHILMKGKQVSANRDTTAKRLSMTQTSRHRKQAATVVDK